MDVGKNRMLRVAVVPIFCTDVKLTTTLSDQTLFDFADALKICLTSPMRIERVDTTPSSIQPQATRGVTMETHHNCGALVEDKNNSSLMEMDVIEVDYKELIKGTHKHANKSPLD